LQKALPAGLKPSAYFQFQVFGQFRQQGRDRIRDGGEITGTVHERLHVLVHLVERSGNSR
jgi:hypothetical protein